MNAKNFSVPELNLVGIDVNGEKSSNMKGPHADSQRNHPMMSQLAMHNNSSTLKDDNSLA